MIPHQSTKRNRIYYRKFDHDKARIKFNNGARVTDLALEYGVERRAIYYAVQFCPRCGHQGVPGRRRGGPAAWRKLCLQCVNNAFNERAMRIDSEASLDNAR